uniref:Uncharacterized protein n=1 Tax=viral metagenome TaxID=1070528 RepID=A0A6H1ZFN6_9ZZZZ
MSARIEIDGINHDVSDDVAALLYSVSKERDELLIEKRCCDTCEGQEEGGHYCLIHGEVVKNMDLCACVEWTRMVE